MNKATFPIIALLIGLFIQLVLMTAISATSEPVMPLLTLLLMAEFGVIVSAVGAFIGGKLLLTTGFDYKLALPALGCLALVMMLGIEGLNLWDYINDID